ncbi:MAG TPA: R3H domain-containing nucleic acid-binding protein [Candidatus Woesebacteria bacterium]|nr:R3H domain-containing nucleic acid-binding protein [Candidatus Woesebacteria bacterium]
MNNKKRNETILKLTCELLEKMNFEVEKAFVEDMDGEENQVMVGITVNNPAGLIGFRGRNLASIQFVLSLIIRSQVGEGIRVLLDVNNYRSEQKVRLEGMVKNLAEKVLATGKEVSMANMSSYERRICHMVLAEMEGVISESEGEGEERHIVIKKC